MDALCFVSIVSVPSGLQHLACGDDFNQSLDNLNLPSGYGAYGSSYFLTMGKTGQGVYVESPRFCRFLRNFENQNDIFLEYLFATFGQVLSTLG